MQHKEYCYNNDCFFKTIGDDVCIQIQPIWPAPF